MIGNEPTPIYDQLAQDYAQGLAGPLPDADYVDRPEGHVGSMDHE